MALAWQSRAMATGKKEVGHARHKMEIECVDDGLGKLQESDLLEQIPPGEREADVELDAVRLVSLGCFCGPKLSFQRLGRGAETLPFDWVRTRREGLLHLMRNDFEGFFDFTTKKPVPGSQMTMFRGYHHSFWHDNPTESSMRERYTRRIQRWKEIDGSRFPVLFVRAAGVLPDELENAPELLRELQDRFGEHCSLLLVLDFQHTCKGAAIVEGHPNLFLYFLGGDAHADGDFAPYSGPVKMALDWVVGRPVEAMSFPSLEAAVDVTDVSTWGLAGLGGLDAFEAAPPSPLMPEGSETPQPPLPCRSEQFLDVEALEVRGGELPAAEDDHVILISLGCTSGPKRTFQAMGRGREALPFDWLRTSHEGAATLLRSSFEGFTDYTTKLPVPGTPLTMYRHDFHSFWHSDPNTEATRNDCAARVANLDGLASSGQTLLFVRTVATTEELLRADELMGALSAKFGEAAALLLIVEFQAEVSGAHVVEGLDDLIVYFLGPEAHEDVAVSSAPYRIAVETALLWLKGEPLECAGLQSLRDLHALAEPTHWGLEGLGGLRAFEGLSAERPITPLPEPSDASPSEAIVGAPPG